MAITFDPIAKRIVLDSASVTAEQIWSRWRDWATLSDNSKYGAVLSHVGGTRRWPVDPELHLPERWLARAPDGGQPQPRHYREPVRYRGGVPVVNTLGDYNVVAQQTVPVQAQGISTSGSTGPSAESIAAAVLSALQGTTIPGRRCARRLADRR